MSDLNVERLLYEEESSYIDFKQEQYRFAEEENKHVRSELLKDILAFANAWRRQEAFILIGVEEVKGGRSIVHGVSEHLEDASVQEFVNSKINKPILFRYEAHTVNGESVGIIRISEQKRPFYTTKDYGKVKRHVVYLRRNSNTAKAEPSEVFEMGESSKAKSFSQPVLEVQLGNRDTEDVFSTSKELESTVIALPDSKEIPSFGSEDDFLGVTLDQTNRNYYRDFGEYLRSHAMLKPLSFRIRNVSSVVAKNVGAQVAWEAPGEFVVRDDYPKKPIKKGPFLPDTHRLANHQIERKDGFWRQNMSLGNIKPKESVWSPTFYVGSSTQCLAEALITVYADNLPNPHKEVCGIEIYTRPIEISLEKLLDVANK